MGQNIYWIRTYASPLNVEAIPWLASTFKGDADNMRNSCGTGILRAVKVNRVQFPQLGDWPRRTVEIFHEFVGFWDIAILTQLWKTSAAPNPSPRTGEGRRKCHN